MAKTAQTLAAAPRVAWNAKALSKAIPAAIKQRNAVAEKNKAKPASPFDIHFGESVGFISLILFKRDKLHQPSIAPGNLIEIKFGAISASSFDLMWKMGGLTDIKMAIRDLSIVDCKGERAMRFYFDIRDKLAIPDEVGRDLKTVSEAVLHAKYLAADLRCLESSIRPRLTIQVIGEGRRQVHEEAVFA